MTVQSFTQSFAEGFAQIMNYFKEKIASSDNSDRNMNWTKFLLDNGSVEKN